MPPAPKRRRPLEEFAAGTCAEIRRRRRRTRPDLQKRARIRCGRRFERLSLTLRVQSFRRHDAVTPRPSFDFGVGYRFNNWSRVDGTLEYRAGAPVAVRSSLSRYLPPPFSAARWQYADSSADVSSVVGLVNGYVDLGTYWGADAVRRRRPRLRSTICSPASPIRFAYASFGSLGPSGSFLDNGSKTSFAWALMAGLDFDVLPN